MIRVIDRTLSVLDKYAPSKEDTLRLLELLLASGADVIELSTDMADLLGNSLPEKGCYLLRIQYPETAALYPRFGRFVCRRRSSFPTPEITLEIQANDIRDIYLLNQRAAPGTIRICGFDDILNHNYEAAFSQLHKKIKGNIELCPQNQYGCAAAVAVEWILSGEGTDVVASFGGIGELAPFEEVMLALHVVKRFKPRQSFAEFPEMRRLAEKITGMKFSRKKAVIGEGIFDVEAGVHVNGILKSPKTYEPFPPELVGNKRKIVLGKHSGKSSVLLKLAEMGIQYLPSDSVTLLRLIRERSVKQRGALSDEDIRELVQMLEDSGKKVNPGI